MGFGIAVGLFVFVIPGIILSLLWCVAIPACAVENLGAVASLSRSSALTRGYRLKILALGILIFAAYLVIQIVSMVLFGLLGVAGSVLYYLFTICLSAFGSVISATLYFELRNLKEGVSMDDLSHVFE